MSVTLLHNPTMIATRAAEPAGLTESLRSLIDYCRQRDWSGYDPYDALNSAVFNALPLGRSRFCRLALTQTLKRLPVNVRRLLMIKPAQNPKALGLFLAALVRLEGIGLMARSGDSERLVDRLQELRSPGTSSWCWGYSFPWQTRTDLVPRFAPNVVCTTFVANALLDAHDRRSGDRCFAMAESAAAFLLRERSWKTDDAAGFSYPMAGMRSEIHNANLLGAALLLRVATKNGDRELLHAGLAVARHAVSRQNKDGSWYYGESASQRWIDNFHTGFNLCALRAIGQYADTDEFLPALRRGYAFYRDRFFRDDGAPKYYHDRLYPIDVHAVAQSIITLAELADLDEQATAQARRVFRWAHAHMRDEQGYFHYQIRPLYRNRIPYMRWAQAWMLLAMSALLERTINSG